MSQPNNPWYQTNAPQQNPAPNSLPISQQNPAPNSPPNNPWYSPWYPQPNIKQNSTWYPTRVLRILLIVFGVMVLVAVPLLGYFIGNFIGIHMATSDIQQGYAYGGLLSTVYNATHNPTYIQEAQVSQSLGIAEGQTDLSGLSMLGILAGITADIAIAFLIVREYENLES